MILKIATNLYEFSARQIIITALKCLCSSVKISCISAIVGFLEKYIKIVRIYKTLPSPSLSSSAPSRVPLGVFYAGPDPGLVLLRVHRDADPRRLAGHQVRRQARLPRRDRRHRLPHRAHASVHQGRRKPISTRSVEITVYIRRIWRKPIPTSFEIVMQVFGKSNI